MQQFLTWLGTKLFGSPDGEQTSNRTPRGHKPTVTETRRRTTLIAGDRGVAATPASRIRQQAPDNDDTLEIERDQPKSAGGTGFDPYNTGSFDRSANWSRRTRG